MATYKELNENIIELVGGKDNIKAVAHCVTRLRLTLKDRSIAQTEKIKELEGVLDVVSNDVAYQIIIGTQVVDVYSELMGMIDLKQESVAEEKEKPKGIKGIFTSMLAAVSETMTSIIEVILAAGILAGGLAVLAMIGVINKDGSTYMILDTMRASVFHFLPILIAASASKRLNINPYLGIILAATLLSQGIDGAEGLSIFGIKLMTISYANTFIPIMLGIWFMSKIIRVLEKVIPKSLHYFLVSVLALVITLPVVLIVFGPIGTLIGDGLNGFFEFLQHTIGNWIVVALYSALQPLLIVIGAANFTYPIVLNFLGTLGYDPIFSAAATISDIAVCGTMLGYFLRSKNKKEKQMFGTMSFSALMGVTEPAVFGAFVKYGRPFYAAGIGGAVGGTIAGLAGVKTMAMAWGLAGLPTYLVDGTRNFIWMMISVVASFTISALAAYGIGLPKGKEKTEADTKKVIEKEEAVSDLAMLSIGKVAEGDHIELNKVADKAFSSGALGNGFGIKPIPQEKIEILAPVDGEITVVFPTKHAYGLKTATGVEVLIHIGIDTVNLDGKFFTSEVEVGETVVKGQLIATYNSKDVEAAGFDTTIITVVTNTADFLDVIKAPNDSEDELTVVF